jgi:predicted nucleic acid-binding protein
LSELLLVDSSAWIEAMRPKGRREMREYVSELMLEGKAAWCDMIRLELWNGARPQEHRDLFELELTLPLLEITSEVWRQSNQLARKARSAGMTFPPADLLIAACADHYGVKIVHQDRHFEQIAIL